MTSTFNMKMETRLRSRIEPLRLMIFDVDGVLTDGRLYYCDDGSEMKAFDVQDGHGIKLLERSGVRTALLSGRCSKAVEHRAHDLGITIVYQGIKVKTEAYEKILITEGLEDREVGYMGDDMIDIPVLRRVGFAVCPANASPHVQPYAHYVTQAPGGRGACREVCEMILKIQGKWDGVTRRYFS